MKVLNIYVLMVIMALVFLLLGCSNSKREVNDNKSQKIQVLWTEKIDAFPGDESKYLYYISKVKIEDKELILIKNESKYGVREEGAFGIESWTDASSQFDSILNIITLFIAVVASIALLVGGIGVMNIMLVSVTERTREIGIRKSLGAKTKAIKRQFMAEAGLITLIGGLIGIATGLILGTIICVAIGAKPAFSLLSILLASLFSCGIGLFFGIYPAKKAAMLNPIEALRHE